MRRFKAVGLYFLVFALIAAGLLVVSSRLLGPKIGNTFSTIANSLPDSEPSDRPTMPSLLLTPSGGSGESPLTEVDRLLQQSMIGSLAYNAPNEMKLDETLPIELVISPSLSVDELKKQVNAPGTVVTSSDVKITDQMEAKIFSPDPNAFTIQALQEPRQLISELETTKWTWYVTANKSGKQKLSVVVYRVVEYQGEKLSRVVKEYESDIDVKVTPQSQSASLWAIGLGILLLGGIIAAWFWYGNRKREQAPGLVGYRRTSRSKRKSQGNLFISYRRSDSADIVGRIYDSLVSVFGRDPIFKDVDSIPLGVDFQQYLDQKVSECNVLLAVIGDDWLDSRDPQGRRRIDDPEDFVRIEIQSALERNIPVIPLLVRGAQMPAENSLPPALQKLVYKNGMPVRPDPDFHHDIDRLIAALDEYI